jgi:hypothetical protein
MKRIFWLVIAVGILTAGIAKAEEAKENPLSICNSIASYAETAMTKRQEGFLMVQMMEIAIGSDSDNVNEFGRTIIIEAYEHPRYSTTEFQREAIADFRDRWYLWCAKQVSTSGAGEK